MQRNKKVLRPLYAFECVRVYIGVGIHRETFKRIYNPSGIGEVITILVGGALYVAAFCAFCSLELNIPESC